MTTCFLFFKNAKLLQVILTKKNSTDDKLSSLYLQLSEEEETGKAVDHRMFFGGGQIGCITYRVSVPKVSGEAIADYRMLFRGEKISCTTYKVTVPRVMVVKLLKILSHE